MGVLFALGLGAVLVALGDVLPRCGGVYLPTTCPSHCQCEMAERRVVCQHLTNTSWADLLLSLPNVTESLVLSRSHLAFTHTRQGAPLEGNVTAPYVLRSLRHLEVTSCTVSGLSPGAFDALPSLEECKIRNTSLADLPLEGVFELALLTRLYLENADIEHIPEGTFAALPRLGVLSLHGNQLGEVTPGQFVATPNLYRLNLGRNRISYVHPHAFRNLTGLSVLDLGGNQLEYLHESVFGNLTSASSVSLLDNPWDCSCGLRWLVDALRQSGSGVAFQEETRILCSTPPDLQDAPIRSLDGAALSCAPPRLDTSPEATSILFVHSDVLRCRASGYPPPSTFWITPRGPLVHPDHRKWLSIDMQNSPHSLSFDGPPTHFKSQLVAKGNGDLDIRAFRYYFEGEFTCVAESPAGVVMATVNVTVHSNIEDHMVTSLMWASCAVGGVLALGILSGIIRLCIRNVCCEQDSYKPNLVVLMTEPEDSPSMLGMPSAGLWRSPWWSPDSSPRKCVTPAEDLGAPAAPDKGLELVRDHIRERLEAVRGRLRINLERHADRIRMRAQHMRRNRERYIQNIRDSSKTIKKNTGHYAHKVAVGMVLGVEQVKGHIRAVKGMCGPGELAHTVSTFSVSTDVDSQEKQEVLKTVTFV